MTIHQLHFNEIVNDIRERNFLEPFPLDSAARAMQNLNSPTNPNAQFPIQSKMKRKR